MKKPMLTRKQIEAAKLDVSHPVVQALIGMHDYCKHFNEEFAKVKQDNQLAQDFVKRNMAPLAHKINDLDEFSLKPLDIISIWSQVDKSFLGRYVKYSLANIIAAKYSVIGIKSPKWGEFIVHESKSEGTIDELPEDLINDKENILYFYRRWGEVIKNLKEIDFFYGISIQKDIGDLDKKAFKDGDKGAERRDDNSAAQMKNHDYSFLEGVVENWGNGLYSSFLFSMPKEIRKEIFIEN